MTWLWPSSPCTSALSNRRLLRLGWAGGRNVRLLMFSSGVLWFSWNGFWSNKLFLNSIQQFTSFWTALPGSSPFYNWKPWGLWDSTSTAALRARCVEGTADWRYHFQTAKKKNEWLDYHDILYRHSWSLEDNFSGLWWSLVLSSSAIIILWFIFKILPNPGCVQTAGRSLRRNIHTFNCKWSDRTFVFCKGCCGNNVCWWHGLPRLKPEK